MKFKNKYTKETIIVFLLIGLIVGAFLGIGITYYFMTISINSMIDHSDITINFNETKAVDYAYSLMNISKIQEPK